MGSPFGIIFYAPDSAAAHALAAAAYAHIDSLNLIFSDYLPHSELSQLSATAGKDSFVSPSPLLYGLLKQSKAAWVKSNGTFDVTVGALSQLWRAARKQKTFPSPEAVAASKNKTAFKHLLIDTAQQKVKLLQPGMLLDLGGIAKGYTAQSVIHFLKAHGVTTALVDAGGDVACSGAPPGTSGWTIGINVPGRADALITRTLQLQQGAVATSGDVYQYTVHKGKKYSHIINPKTGYGVTFQRNVTVIANDGATADWLATACSILPRRKAKKLARQHGAQLLVTEQRKRDLKSFATRGFARYWSQQ